MTNLQVGKDKLIYFVMGRAGSGKTVLSNQLAEKIKGKSEVFDDYDYHSIDPKYKYKLQAEVTQVRHTGKTIFINTLSPRFLHNQWNVKENPYVTWILTSLSSEEFRELSKTFSTKYLKKLFKAYRNVCLRKRIKTRPYLSITLNSDKTKFVYEYHRFKKQISEAIRENFT